jgi:hypothetical protein
LVSDQRAANRSTMPSELIVQNLSRAAPLSYPHQESFHF